MVFFNLGDSKMSTIKERLGMEGASPGETLLYSLIIVIVVIIAIKMVIINPVLETKAEEVKSGEVSSIPPERFSPRSILSFCGIIFLIICIVPFRKGILAGIGANSVILTVSLIFYILFSSSSGLEARFISSDGKMSVAVDDSRLDVSLMDDNNLVIINKNGPNNVFDMRYKYFAMHCPDYEGLNVNPYIYHPGAFLFIPCFFCLPVIVFFMLFREKVS